MALGASVSVPTLERERDKVGHAEDGGVCLEAPQLNARAFPWSPNLSREREVLRPAVTVHGGFGLIAG